MPMTQPHAATVTLLFTDLVNSTALLQRAGRWQVNALGKRQDGSIHDELIVRVYGDESPS